MFRSATVKLTLWYVLLATGLCVLFSIVMYQLSTHELTEALTQQYTIFTDNDHDNDNVPPPHPEIKRHAQRLFMQLVMLNGAVIIGSSVAGYFLARRTLKPIEQSHQIQTRFTAEASHELRTPLAAMKADTEVALMEKDLSNRARRTLQGNLHDIEHLEQLTSRLLDIARYQNKALRQPELLDIDEIVRGAINQSVHGAQEKQVTIKQELRPVQVMGEQRALEQLVIIVLDNAIKYSHAQGVVDVSLRAVDNKAELTIKDSGIGIPASDLPHVFERFYRSNNAQQGKKMVAGYGLGLPLAQEIVSAHGGELRVTSREGVNTVVCITLPIVPAPSFRDSQ